MIFNPEKVQVAFIFRRVYVQIGRQKWQLHAAVPILAI